MAKSELEGRLQEAMSTAQKDIQLAARFHYRGSVAFSRNVQRQRQTAKKGSGATPRWWERVDLNHRSLKASDLQSDVIDRSTTLPY